MNHTFKETKPTHYGWLGFMPVNIQDEGDGWVLSPRFGLPIKFITWTADFYSVIGQIGMFFNPNFDPEYPVKITGEYHE